MPADLTAVTPYGPGAGSSRVRVFDWLARIPELSTTVLPYAGLGNAGVGQLVRHPRRLARAEAALRGLLARPPQRLLLHREASPFSRGGIEASLAWVAEYSVYDFDDALQWDGARSPATRMFPKSAKALSSVRAADRVIAGNDTLADWACDHAADVVVIPSCVDPTAYRVKDDFGLHDPPRLIWLGSPSTEQYLVTITAALQELHRRYGARLTLISGATPRSLGRLDRLVDRVTWSAATFADDLARGDLAIAPLSDSPYARGKCAYKVLQYGAAGLPFVASPVGANASVTRRLGGTAASTDDDWIGAVGALLEAPPGTRRALGLYARRAVEQYYSFDAWREAWVSAVLGSTDRQGRVRH